MIKTLLFIAIIILCKTFTDGFVKLTPRLILSSKTKLNVMSTSTTFYDNDDEDWKDKRKKKHNFNYDYDYDSNFNSNNLREVTIKEFDDCETLYTLIWFDCEDCRNLLSDAKKDHKKILYIDGSYYFFDENDETNTPLFYKNDELIATDIFSIYEELFCSKIIEE